MSPYSLAGFALVLLSCDAGGQHSPAAFGDACHADDDCASARCVSERCLGSVSIPVSVVWQRPDPQPGDAHVLLFRTEDIPDFQTGRGLEPRLALMRHDLEEPVTYPASVTFEGVGAGKLEIVAYVEKESEYVPREVWVGVRRIDVLEWGGVLDEYDEPIESDSIVVVFTGITSLEDGDG